MKYKIILLLLLLSGFCLEAQVGISTASNPPDSSAMLDVQSTDKGVLIPRLNRNQKDDIEDPAEGLLIYQLDYGPGFYVFKADRWQRIQDDQLSLSEKGLVLDSCVQLPIVDVDNFLAGGAFTSTMYWQGFQANRSANLIGVRLGIVGSQNRKLNGYFNVYRGEGISGERLLQLVIDDEQLRPKFFENTPVWLMKDSFYTIQVVDTLDVVSWSFQGGDTYPPSTSNFGQDLNFQTFVDSCGEVSIIDRYGDGIAINQVDTIHFSDGTFMITNQDDDMDPLNEIQMLSIDSQSLTIIGGNTVMLPNNADNLGNHTATANIKLGDQYISKDGDNEGIRIDNVGRVGIGISAPEVQLDVDGQVRGSHFIGDGSLLTGLALRDLDNDTKIEVERIPDEDMIRIDIAGKEFIKIDGKTLDVNSPGESLLIGHKAGSKVDGQFRGNTYVGFRSGEIDTSGQWNTGLGGLSLINNTSGSQNTAIGRESMVANNSGLDNTAVGYVSLRLNTDGINNTAIGSKALVLNSLGNDNSALGNDALFSNTSGNNNTAVGAGSLMGNIDGSLNTTIGYKADVDVENLKNATAIGANAKVARDSSLVLGDAANVGIGTSSPDARLHVVGQIKMVDGTEGKGKIMVSDSTGKSTWISPSEISIVPDTALVVPILYHGDYLYVHPVDNGDSISWQMAIDACNSLNAFGFDDWYLPTRLELDAMYKQSYLITGLSQTSMAKYWSATEFDVGMAYTQRLDFGGPDPDDKTEETGHNCRCVRRN